MSQAKTKATESITDAKGRTGAEALARSAKEAETAVADQGLFEDGSPGRDPPPGGPPSPPQIKAGSVTVPVDTAPLPARVAARPSRFRGRLSIEGGAVLLSAGGLRAEVLLCDAPPEDAAAAAQERARAVEELRALDRTEVVLQGVQVGDLLLSARPGQTTTVARSQYRGGARQERFREVWDVIQKKGQSLLDYDGVLSVRAGFRFKDGWITREPAIVVTVRNKRAPNRLPSGQALPSEIDGIAVDVCPATPPEQIAGAAGESAAESAEISAPGWELVGADAPEASELTAELDEYVPPADATLAPVTAAMSVLCHVSPDRGFPTLDEFLQTVRENLTVAMYDFTAPHILESVKSAMSQATGELTLVLDPKVSLPAASDPKSSKAADFTEEQVIEELSDQLGDSFKHRWAAVKLKDKTTGGIYPSAYHIKVAVADSRRLWASSGNWQSSNQPALDMTGADAGRRDVLRKYNREWHVIIEHPGLAKTFERFILNDYEQAASYQIEPESGDSAPDLFVPRAALFAPEAAEDPVYFAPRKFVFRGAKKLKVQPLLTPDNFAPLVLAEIAKAERAVLFQNQSLSIGKRPRAEFLKLVDALRKKQEDGLDVRIIFRTFGFDDRQALEALADRGFDMRRVKLQNNCHTKGILIDDQVTVVGSHNWTSQGTTENRDASFIFYSPEITAYYKAVFEHDWRVLAKSKLPSEEPEMMPIVAESAEAAPPAGYVRMRWEHFYTD